ncbi:hypothetical protein [Rhodococcus wratislaviensis]|uniref:hypothetical protein n=1 Tax=Rhodococcus wratislaviensis TaxID=44752 RepID=UPI003663C528
MSYSIGSGGTVAVDLAAVGAHVLHRDDDLKAPSPGLTVAPPDPSAVPARRHAGIPAHGVCRGFPLIGGVA